MVKIAFGRNVETVVVAKKYHKFAFDISIQLMVLDVIQFYEELVRMIFAIAYVSYLH